MAVNVSYFTWYVVLFWIYGKANILKIAYLYCYNILVINGVMVKLACKYSLLWKIFLFAIKNIKKISRNIFVCSFSTSLLWEWVNFMIWTFVSRKLQICFLQLLILVIHYCLSVVAMWYSPEDCKTNHRVTCAENPYKIFVKKFCSYWKK